MNTLSLKRLVAIVCIFCSCISAYSQKYNLKEYIHIEIVPDHENWTYHVGENAQFAIRVIRANVPMRNVNLQCEIGPEKMPATKKVYSLMEKGSFVINGGTMEAPGFLTCQCQVTVNGKTYKNFINVAFDPEKIAPTTTRPKDFDRFWEQAIQEARAIDLDPLITLMPEKCTPKVNVYHVRFQHYQKDTYMYGWLCVPKAEGKYPAILCVPGAGVKPIPAETELAEQGVITFSIGVNGIPQTLPEEAYRALRYGVLHDYAFIHLDSKEHYYYRRVYTGCVRAMDFIHTLPQFDGSNLGVTGGSQGGALAIVTAALDPRVKALVAVHPALCDLTGYLHGRAGGWPHLFNERNKKLNNTPAKIETTRYYDVVNFARNLKAAGYYSWGFNDPTCPPTSFYAAYNVIKAPKQLFVAHETGHWRMPEQDETIHGWLVETLKNGK